MVAAEWFKEAKYLQGFPEEFGGLAKEGFQGAREGEPSKGGLVGGKASKGGIVLRVNARKDE